MKLKLIKSRIQLASLLFISVVVTIVACNKNKVYDTYIAPDGGVHFIGDETKPVDVLAPSVPITLKVGATDVVNFDRTVTLNITSPTGATAGSQYTVTTGTVTIAKGQTTGDFVFVPDFDSYNDGLGRKDTLIATLTPGTDTKIAPFLDTIKIVLRGPCSEADMVVDELLGNYTNSNEFFAIAYGPYTTSISNPVPLSATSARITVNNIFDWDLGPIDFILDWSNPLSTTTTVVPKSTGIGDGGKLSTSYAGYDIAVHHTAGSAGTLRGTYSYCNQQFTFRFWFGVAQPGGSPVLGYFTSNPYTLTIKR